MKKRWNVLRFSIVLLIVEIDIYSDSQFIENSEQATEVSTQVFYICSSSIFMNEIISIYSLTNTQFQLFSVFKKSFPANHINCRQKSSQTDGNILPLKYESITRDKVRRIKYFKTSVTQGE